VNVTAAAGAGVGNLTVVARLGANQGGLVAAPSSLELLSVATTIPSAGLNRTVVDEGESLGVAVNGTGAAGYAYLATIDPGLGLLPVSVPCASTPSIGSTVVLFCAASVDYSTGGTAQPVVTLSNGASSAVWVFPEVTVDPAPTVSLLPTTLVGYVDREIPVTIEAATGSGTGPYLRACLAPGSGPLQCSASPGPSWTFETIYSTAGSYSVRGWVIDATGANRSVAATLQVDAPLAVALPLLAAARPVGVPLSLSAVLSGGDLPARVWWNVTGASDPVASPWVSFDGPLDATYVPLAVGFVTVSVVVIDALGSVVRESTTLTVGVGPAASIEPTVLPTATETRAGAPIALSWQALDRVGEFVHNFS
jgi:hypothetical protein